MKKNRKVEQPSDSDGNGWLTTFNDMMTLLMVFFVLIFSMGSIDLNRSTGMIQSLQSGLGVLEQGGRLPVSVVDPMSSREVLESAAQKVFSSPDLLNPERFRQVMRELGSRRGVQTRIVGKGVNIIMSENILFDNGVAAIRTDGSGTLDKVAAVIKAVAAPVRVEGHTDNVPIHTVRYPSNWELSAARAVNVVKFFQHAGGISAARLSAVGYGDSKPVGPNDTAANRARNRRVEIVLVMQEGK